MGCKETKITMKLIYCKLNTPFIIQDSKNIKISTKNQLEKNQASERSSTRQYLAKPFPIPKIHVVTLQTEVNILVNILVLKRKNNSE